MIGGESEAKLQGNCSVTGVCVCVLQLGVLKGKRGERVGVWMVLKSTDSGVGLLEFEQNPPSTCATLDKLLNLSKPCFCHL